MSTTINTIEKDEQNQKLSSLERLWKNRIKIKRGKKKQH